MNFVIICGLAKGRPPQPQIMRMRGSKEKVKHAHMACKRDGTSREMPPNDKKGAEI